MAKQTINQGTAPTGAGGDTFRSGSAKLQANDDEIYSQLGANTQGVLPAALPVNKGGTGATTVAAARKNLGLGSAATLNAGKSDKDMVPTVRDTFLHQGDLSGVGNLNDLDDRDSLAVVGVWTCTSSATPTLDKNFPEAGIGGSLLVAGSTFGVSQLYLGRNGIIHFRNSAPSTSGSFLSWAKQYSTRNTTVDSNGFIKAASPIIQLFADKIELNNEAQLQEITFEKLAVGDYLIKGSSGFAQEGWYVETPKDANGNVLVAVVYEQIANGDISVKTYDYMLNNKGRIVADTETPLDIPDGRWIDLRLQELPQPEIEVTDDPEQ